MSNYLGFEPCNDPHYFFVSYNSEDADRVGEIARRLHHGNIPLWYDHGIDYGEAWENKISEKLMHAEAVILFFTKGILQKEPSYVHKEYIMATDFFEKPVYVVIMDDIQNKDVPYTKVPWWIDIQSKQCVNAVGVQDHDAIVQEIAKAIGMSTHEDRMNAILKNYKQLYDNGQLSEAEVFLAQYMNGMSLAGKAKCIADMFSGRIHGLSLPDTATAVARLPTPLVNHVGQAKDTFVECLQLTVRDVTFTFGNSFVFHRGALGDAHVINVWKDEENIFTLGGLVEANNMQIYYDSVDDILYATYVSDCETRTAGDVEIQSFVSVITVEDPLGNALCNSFKWLVEV